MYAANYRSGLRVSDVSTPESPVEIAFFDTFPSSDSASFNGAWSSYPFLDSGTIIVSDIERGMFLLKVDLPPVSISTANELPAFSDPAGGTTVQFAIEGDNGGSFEAGTGTLFVDSGDGQGFVGTPLVEQTAGVFAGELAAAECGTVVRYYVQAQATDGTVVTLPSQAPVQAFEAIAGEGEGVLAFDDAETDLGWTVGAPGDTASTGVWERVVPIGTSAAPGNDNPAFDGSFAWVTQNGSPGGSVGEADVDGGGTTLISPAYDATGGDTDAFIEFALAYSNDAGANPGTDFFPISISNDNGASWQPLVTLTDSTGGWQTFSYRVADFVPPTDALRLRFVARDDAPGSIVEAAVDDVRVVFTECPPITPACAEDVTGDGVVDVLDLNRLLAAFNGPASADPPADVTGDGVIDVLDLNALLAAFNSSC
jgi:hypothetical protein